MAESRKIGPVVKGGQAQAQGQEAGQTPDHTAESLGVLWRRYKRHHRVEDRNALMLHYLPLIRGHAEAVRAKLPEAVELDDLIGAGHFGLLDAIDKFNPGRGIKFETFSSQRIRGAMLDHLRGMDWAPRLPRSRAKRFLQAMRQLEMETGRRPTDEMIRSRLGVSEAVYDRIRRDAQVTHMVSMHRRTNDDDSPREYNAVDVMVDPTQVDPYEAAQRRDLRHFVTRHLSNMESLIVVLYYWEQMTMSEIGRTLALSESRICQMHTLIKARLRDRFSNRMAELEPAAA